MTQPSDPQRFRLLFFEPTHTGHHYPYLARMLPGFVDLPIDIALATTEQGVASEQFEKTLAPFADRVEMLTCCVPPSGKPLATAWQWCRELSAAVRDWRPDHAAVMYADGMWQVAALARMLGWRCLGSGPEFEAWMYRGRFAYPDSRRPRDRARWGLFRRLLRSDVFAKIHFDDELVIDRVATLGEVRTDVVLPANPIVLREPVDQQRARVELDIASEGPLISCSGQIARYKGAHLSLEAFRRFAETDRTKARLLLAGPHEDAVLELARSAPLAKLVESGRLILQNRFLSEHEMLLVAEASDLVLAPYPNHSGRSSIILWAAGAGRPVLGTDSGCIGHVIEKEQLGSTCEVGNVDAFAAAMRHRLGADWNEEDRCRVRAYSEWHRVENYQAWSSQRVRERIGAPAFACG